ncbi:MAG: NAD(+) synthase [Muribaculaceae bacterium]|nr:NAD(+) synthase [Muribaculaceae bacterium]
MSKVKLNFNSDYGMLRVASLVPRVNVADVPLNVRSILESIASALAQGAQLIVLPELAVTGYTCGDLLGNDALLTATERGVTEICQATADADAVVVVGAPLRARGHLFNCAVVMNRGKMWVVPKTYLPNYKEFYEKRWFTSDNITRSTIQDIVVDGNTVPFGTNMIFDAGMMKMAVEICEDLWVPIPPSAFAAINGANVLVNLSASNEVVGKHDYLVNMIKHHSDHNIAAYVYSSAGYGESTTDLVFAGNAIITENGNILAQGDRFITDPQMVVADVDLESLENERRVNGSFTDSLLQHRRNYQFIPVQLSRLDYSATDLKRHVRNMPFVPSRDAMRDARCEEIVNIQTQGLMRRLAHTGIKSVVIGISGGIDSTLALMIAVRALDRLNLSRENIVGITMPGFGTTGRTLTNALELMKALGITVKEIPIAEAVKLHLDDIEHDLMTHDTTYENAQARERTQILMDYANKIGGLVLGTGDLSELALGWATYNGDHMSMYNVNGSVPKTLAKHLINWFASTTGTANPKSVTIRSTLLDVLATPISPELTPADSKGNIQQKTEDIIGPYDLHDFFLYNMLRHGFGPGKIYFLACHAFDGSYAPAVIKKWLCVFVRRFFSQQFKRSCLPDGPKVGNVSLSPRGDWRMPSDASAAVWIAQCDALPDEQ